ncbi:spinster family MFS transporter [Haliea sp. E17]|uniref:spinster family MFS transporter n=1 Tax=Haliea sp. E17 TaxID=3401576 RepID=UPI003AAEBC06
MSTTPNPGNYSNAYLRYVLVIAFLVIAVSLMDRYIVSILLEQIGTDLGLSDTQLGLLVGPAFVVVHILCQFPLARYADRSSRRTLIGWAIALWSLFTMAGGFARNFAQLFIARMGVGITEAASSPALASLLSDYFPPHKRGLAMSMLSIGGVAGIGAGMLLGGFAGQAWGWRTALIVAGIPGLLLALLVWFTIAEPLRGGNDGPTPATGQRGTRETLGYLWGNRTYCWIIAGASLSMVAGIGRGAWEPVFLIRVYGMEQATAGMVYFLISPLPGMLGALLGGMLVDRLSKRDIRWNLWLPTAALMSSLPLLAGFLLWPQDDMLWGTLLPVGLACSIVASLLGGAVSPPLIATSQSLVDASTRATAHAMWTIVGNLVGMGLGPVAAGWLSEYYAPSYGAESIRYALLIVSLAVVPAGLALYMGSRHIVADFDRRNAETQSTTTVPENSTTT